MLNSSPACHQSARALCRPAQILVQRLPGPTKRRRPHPIPPVILPDLPEDRPGLPFADRLLEHEPRGQGVAVEAPGGQDGLALGDQVLGPGVFSFRYKDFREVDGEEDEIVLEVAGPEIVPELGEDGLGFGVVPEPEGDSAFEPVEAELGPAVGELAIEGTGSVQGGQGVFRLAEVVQVPGEVVLGTEAEPGFAGGVDEDERLADVGEAPFGVDVADGVAHLEEGAAL